MSNASFSITKALAGLAVLGVVAVWVTGALGDLGSPGDAAEPRHEAGTAAPADGRRMASSSPRDAADMPVPSQPAPASAAAAAAASRPAATRPVGSEGYGPQILSALNEGGPLDAYHAAALISRCKGIDRDVAAVFKMGESPEMQKRNKAYLQTLDYVQTEQRRCQTVSRDIAASRPQLLLKAAEGKVLGAAALYIADMHAGADLEAASRDTAVRALRRDGELGDAASLFLLWSQGAELSGSESDRRAFKLAYQLITDKYPDGVRAWLDAVPMHGALAEHWSEALTSLFRREETSAEEKAKAAVILARYERRRQALQPGRP